MTNGVEATESLLTASGPNDVSLTPHFPDGRRTGKETPQPDWYEGIGTYTVNNKSGEPLNVLISATIAPAAAGGPAQSPLDLPGDAISVTPARVTLNPNENAQAKVDMKLPPQPTGQEAVLSVFFRDELRPNNISTTYSSNVTLQPGAPRRPFPTLWLLIAIAAVLVLVGGGIAMFLLLRGDGSESRIAGDWRNVDPMTNNTTHYDIVASGDNLVISGFGKCSPTDCDWARMAGGPRTVSESDAADGAWAITWEFGFQTRRDEFTLQADGRLRVNSATDFGPDGTVDRNDTQLFAKAAS